MADGDKLDKVVIQALADDLVEDLMGLSDAEVRAKSMFGGQGIFADDVMFAMVTSTGLVCLRTGEENIDEFDAYGSEQFHERMPYHTVPPNIRANNGELRAWAAKSLGISRAANKPKKPKK